MFVKISAVEEAGVADFADERGGMGLHPMNGQFFAGRKRAIAV